MRNSQSMWHKYNKKRQKIVNRILQHSNKQPTKSFGMAFAPSNIALCKYWGKRDEALNLPITDSLSISLRDKGATSKISPTDTQHKIYVNDVHTDNDSAFAKRLIAFLELFTTDTVKFYEVRTTINIPIAAGLASSAAGFAAVVLAMSDLYSWKITKTQLSVLARIGSGSASRSLWQGFVYWNKGTKDDGMDSHAFHIKNTWKDFCIGILMIDASPKAIPSSLAMQNTVHTSKLYNSWPHQVEKDILLIQQAIESHDFQLLGETAENNALSMHATMLSAKPTILYSKPETFSLMQKVWELRKQKHAIYFTQDAGANLKLLFLKQDLNTVTQAFKNVKVIEPFATAKPPCK